MKETAYIEALGVVVAVERGGNFKVRVHDDNGKVVLARCNGKMNKQGAEWV
jgi:translation initiation factor IF-1